MLSASRKRLFVIGLLISVLLVVPWGISHWSAVRNVLTDLFPLITVLATVSIATFTGLLWRISRRQEESTRTIERAYVKMSPTPSGAEIKDNEISFEIEIKNFGRTPANITDFIFTPLFLKKDTLLPDNPPYVRRFQYGTSRAFLVTNDHVVATYKEFQSPGNNEIAELQNGKLDLHIIGYVDYIDQFGRRHRAGFGRTYVPKASDRFPFVLQDRYNYDRQRESHEGKDWD